jgi:hypothetical protein
MENEGLRKSDKVIIEELHQAILDSIFNPALPKMKKGMSAEEIADLIPPWDPKLPWPETDSRVIRLKEMYGATTANIFEGTDISRPDHEGPSIGFRNSILERVGELYREYR